MPSSFRQIERCAVLSIRNGEDVALDQLRSRHLICSNPFSDGAFPLAARRIVVNLQRDNLEVLLLMNAIYEILRYGLFCVLPSR